MEQDRTDRSLPDALRHLAAALDRRAASAPGVARMRAAELLRTHVVDYLLPRATDLAAPLVVVILGSTGSGKSSLFNALAGRAVSPSGPLRPTTRRPVAVVNPADDPRRLRAVAGEIGLELRADEAARSGVVLVDAPDFDSVEITNRESAVRLLEVADLAIFVTTATRYADQVPWEVLSRARQRGVPLMTVLNRLPADPDDAGVVVADYRRLLERGGLLPMGAMGELEVVPVREGGLDLERDALDARFVAPVLAALDRLVASDAERRDVIRRGLAGALGGVPGAVETIAREVEEEQRAVAELRTTADRAYAERRGALADELARGTFLRAEVLRRWQDFINAGQVARLLSEGIGRMVATVRSLVQAGPRPPASEVREAAFADLVALAVQHADTAAQRTAAAWSADRYGALALAGDESLWRASPSLSNRLHADLDEWGARIGREIREMGEQRQGWAKAASLGVNAIGTSAVLAVFVHTGGLTGAEVGITAATAVLNQKLLEAIFGEGNVAAFVRRARGRLDELLDRAFADERARYEAALGSTGDGALAERLRAAAERVAGAVPA